MNTLYKKVKNIEYIVVEPDNLDANRQYPTVFLLHGYGSNMSDLASICEYINTNNYIYICPNAPIEIDTGYGNKGYAWFNINTDQGALKEDKYSDLMNELISEIDREYCINKNKMILGGFSQGAMVTYDFGINKSNYFCGLLAMSGKLINKEIFKQGEKINLDKKIFISHGLYDNVISVNEGREANKIFEAVGFNVEYNEYPITHEISLDVISDIKIWIQKILDQV